MSSQAQIQIQEEEKLEGTCATRRRFRFKRKISLKKHEQPGAHSDSRGREA
jgi:hypothetical protein